ncbi:MAG: signal transduction histidine kinase/CheY-like chemotaxis protein [Ulvibacter sp.]|jgi:signal transduction histidine kinase/CheY-like chemotaxis protein/predicted DNA-binding protein (UPF0251 family)
MFYSLMGRSCLSVLLFLSLISSSLFAQRKLQAFEVKKFGLSVDQPFHSGQEFSTDSIGRLLFSNYSFDGNKFKKREKDTGSIVKIEEDGSKWKIIDQFNVRYITPDSTYELNTKAHFKYSLVNVETDGNDKYLLTNLGIVHFRKEGKRIKHIQNIPLEGENSRDILLQRDTLYIKKLSAITCVLTSDPSTEFVVLKNDMSNILNGIFYLKGNRICLKSIEGFKLFPSSHPYSKTLQPHNDNKIIDFLYDSKNRLWITMRENNNSHLYLYDNSERFDDVLLPIGNSTWLSDIFEDLHGSIWVGSRGGGIMQIHEPLFQGLNKSSGFLSDNIRSIVQRSNGDIHLSVDYNGVDIIRINKEIDHSFTKQLLVCILFDHEDNLWVPAEKGILIYKKNGNILRYQKKDGLMSSRIKIIFQDSKNQVWVGTRKGLNLYRGNHFKPYPVPGIDEYDKVLAIREYEPLRLLVGFESGRVFKFEKGEYEELKFPDNGLNTIFTDRFNNTWLCSENSGLYLFVNQQFVSIKGNNLPTSIKLVQDDLEGYLWGICEQNQLFRLKIEDVMNLESNPKIDYFGVNEGVPMLATNNEIQPNTALLDDGRVIFPNIYGAILIDPEKADQSINSFNTECFYQDSIVKEEITLNYGQNDISLKFNTICIAPNCKISYEYNIGNGWLPFSEEDRLDINNITYGTHIIQLRGRSFNGTWHEVAPVQVFVPPLIYEYPLFWLIIFLIVAVFSYLFVRWKTHKVNERNNLLSTTVNEQTKIIEEEKSQLAVALEKQKLLTRELTLSQTTKNRMYAHISHEFKSPLQAISSHLSKSEGMIHRIDKERIKGNIDNLLGISNEIMELSKAESGNLKLKKNWYNINGVIADQVELKHQLAIEKGITIIQSSKSEKQYLEFDISLFQKVISNLLSNAVKFSPQGGEIQIRSIVSDNYQIVEVTDQGSGVPASEIENLTLAYYQASNNMEYGTGIGLSLVKQILKLHDSELYITSELKKGSTFGFKLKRPEITQGKIIADNINILGISTQISNLLDPARPIILAVDDSKDVLFFINQALSTKYYVITAENGEEALDALEKIKPVAIISDFNMPIMNGIEFLKQVRKLPNYKTLPFLFLIGSSSEETELQSILAGADLILQKPIQEEVLTIQVSQLLLRQKKISASIKSSFAHDLLPKNIQNDDLILMQELESIFLENISNGKLTSQEIADMMGVGEKTFRNRVKGITGKTIKVYFRNFRLEKAKLLLAEGYGNMGEVAAATGFSSLSYFSKSYKAYFN